MKTQQYLVSARKYRPTRFDEVVGQEVIVKTLKNAIKTNQLGQAFLFTGPRGIGKTTTARIFAKTINCENITPDGEACNECPSCISFNQNNSYNIYELDAASNNKVDDIRALIDQVNIPPQVGKYKVYIIDEVHMLSDSAFNAFLKTLEEPPSYAKFILATTERHKILPTILSRCQIYNFKRISNEDIVKHLEKIAKEENISYEIEALHVIAENSDGALRDALSMFDQLASFGEGKISYSNAIENLNVVDYDLYFQLTDNLLKGDLSKTLMLVDHIISNGFEPIHIIKGLAEHVRNLLFTSMNTTIDLLEISEAHKQKLISQVKYCSYDFLSNVLKILSDADVSYMNTQNKRLLLEVSLLKIIDSNKKNSEKAAAIPTNTLNLDPNKSSTNSQNTTTKTSSINIKNTQTIDNPSKYANGISTSKIVNSFSVKEKFNEYKTKIENKKELNEANIKELLKHLADEYANSSPVFSNILANLNLSFTENILTLNVNNILDAENLKNNIIPIKQYLASNLAENGYEIQINVLNNPENITKPIKKERSSSTDNSKQQIDNNDDEKFFQQ
ncbi:MAG TPA: DNA polymerase III subunit gamma/tau, partial [Bacteroidales bacterium]|nr:DNA polymerase III subunit gamma/tau [Bacteroidales bacterium]HRS70161.1 DNA polymerase III subunit gamma/tau [Bacteroidales bacterium]